jgi:hypothetical protein
MAVSNRNLLNFMICKKLKSYISSLTEIKQLFGDHKANSGYI